MSSVWQGGNNTTKIDGVRHSVAGTGMKGLGDGFVNKTVGTMFFGTISGGAAAAVSGGNFWQGAVTGLVVSGLNHAMHRNHERNILNEKIIAAGYDPDATQNMTLEEIKVFAQKVFGSDYSDAGNPFFEYSSEIGNNEGKVIFKVNNINGVCSVEYNGKILLNNNLKGTIYRWIGATIGHELQHAIDIFSGNILDYNIRFNPEISKAYSEDRAYSWELNNGSIKYNKNQHEYYINILKNNGLR